MTYDVAIVPCPDYEPANVREALKAALAPIGGARLGTPRHDGRRQSQSGGSAEAGNRPP